MSKQLPYYLGNLETAPNHDIVVLDKYTGEPIANVAKADAKSIDEAIAAAVHVTVPMRKLPPYERKAILKHCVRRFEERFDDLAMSLCREAGKPIRDARGEVTRLIDTFEIAAEESVRIYGTSENLAVSERAEGYQATFKRVPVGPCSFITPFNFPLNLVAHKVAPAIAAGCPFILKPDSRTPIGALIIGEILAETSLPEGAFSILPCDVKDAGAFTTDDRLKLLSFTGSPRVGWTLKSNAGRKKVILELGGNAACIVDEDTDLNDAADRLVIGAFYQSGQSCIGVQRILVHESVYDTLKSKLLERTTALLCGDPKMEATFVGPLIDESEAVRLSEWIQEAVDAGAKVLCGGDRDGAILRPTLLENVPLSAKLNVEEAFGPVAFLSRFSDFDDALRTVNDSRFGLQAGLFTRDIYKINRAWDTLEVGGVVIGDIPSWRVDNMPYGGVKESGLGREGIRYAIEDMTEIRSLILRTPESER